MEPTFLKLREKVICCIRCPRLVKYRESAPATKKYAEEPYWRRPVPGLGDPNAWLLILGLAPAAQGGNRTGRIFTGDETGRFLFSCLFEAGLSNQPSSESIKDPLQLLGCYATAAVKCVPPSNKPLPSEFLNCSSYLENEIFLLKNLKAVLGLGKWAFDSYVNFLKKQNVAKRSVPFSHGKKVDFMGWPTLYGSYHPSPQNTYTKKLTREMFIGLLNHIKKSHQ